MSKAGVVALTRTLARELKGIDILVNNLIPGPTRTEMNPLGSLEPDTSYPTALTRRQPDRAPSRRAGHADRRRGPELSFGHGVPYRNPMATHTAAVERRARLANASAADTTKRYAVTSSRLAPVRLEWLALLEPRCA